LLTFLTQLSHLFDPYRVEKDVQNFYWMARYQDPGLFPVDHLREGRMVAEIKAFGRPLVIFPPSLGYGLLFWLGSFVIDHVWMAKLLGFLLMPVSVAYLFRLGESIADAFTGATLSLTFAFISLAFGRGIALTLGVQRAFAFPLLIVFTYYLHRRRYWPAAVMTLVSLLFYYPNFLVAALTYVLSMLEIPRPLRVRLDLSRSKVVPLLLTLALSVGVIALTVAVDPSLVQPKDEPLSETARYQSGGVAPMFTGFPLLGRAGLLEDGSTLFIFLTLALVGGLIVAVRKRASLRRPPAVFGHLLVASLVLYGASLFVLTVFSSKVLYLPSRYTRTTLVWVALGFVGINLLPFLDRLGPWLRRNARLVIFFVVSLVVALGASPAFLPVQIAVPALFRGQALLFGGALAILGVGVGLRIVRSLIAGDTATGAKAHKWLAMLGVLVIIVPPAWFYVGALKAPTIDPTPAERDLYEFLATVPKDAMIAGDPHVMVGVPLFSERSVLFHALSPRPDAPIVEFFDAYYAESPRTMLAFCRRYAIDYLVVDRTDFSPEYLAGEEFFYQPYNDDIVQLLAARSDFIAPELEPIFRTDPLAVIPCDARALRVRR
jgi:hypothetical protein